MIMKIMMNCAIPHNKHLLLIVIANNQLNLRVNAVRGNIFPVF